MPLRDIDVEIRWDDGVEFLAPLDEETASSEDGILLNQQYVDYRGLSLDDAQDALREEADLLSELEAAGWDTEEAEEAIEASWESFGLTTALDPGIGGIVLSLAAVGATPISSCNGGVVGFSSHASDIPHVLFTAPAEIARSILQQAKLENVGMIRNGPYAELFVDHLPKFHALAKRLLQHCSIQSSGKVYRD